MNRPELFIMLPSDIDAWRDTDPTTHEFRLNYLCEVKSSRDAKDTQYIHLSNHQVHALNQPYEFFQKYSDYALRLLTMVKYVLSSEDYVFLALHALKVRRGSDFLKNRNWSPKKRNQEFVQYLHVHDGDNPFENLFQCTGDRGASAWRCRHHMNQDASADGLNRLKKYIRNHGRHNNMQKATVAIDLDLFSKSMLLSEAMALNLLNNTQPLAQLLYYKIRGHHPVHILPTGQADAGAVHQPYRSSGDVVPHHEFICARVSDESQALWGYHPYNISHKALHSTVVSEDQAKLNDSFE
ncbi:hypothetical protein MVEG_11345 [Podila verticillata NRRL 6337]|uniref:Uncharacterized protein n=1 Tax=Podila verticillata NRRL 6337 TaxID=1069443 RepID=A0A086TLJ2_9FUNG|nr:hypothetical protein MVEG_11345 [Podila verticillata NRRL 6337]